jgi:hypothetical protein
VIYKDEAETQSRGSRCGAGLATGTLANRAAGGRPLPPGASDSSDLLKREYQCTVPPCDFSSSFTARHPRLVPTLISPGSALWKRMTFNHLILAARPPRRAGISIARLSQRRSALTPCAEAPTLHGNFKELPDRYAPGRLCSSSASTSNSTRAVSTPQNQNRPSTLGCMEGKPFPCAKRACLWE